MEIPTPTEQLNAELSRLLNRPVSWHEPDDVAPTGLLEKTPDGQTVLASTWEEVEALLRSRGTALDDIENARGLRENARSQWRTFVTSAKPDMRPSTKKEKPVIAVTPTEQTRAFGAYVHETRVKVYYKNALFAKACHTHVKNITPLESGNVLPLPGLEKKIRDALSIVPGYDDMEFQSLLQAARDNIQHDKGLQRGQRL